MVKPQPSKLVMSVRFRSPAVCPSVTAPAKKCLTLPVFKGYGDISRYLWSFILHYNCQQMPRNDTTCTNSLRVLLRAQVLYVFQGRVTLSRELFMVALRTIEVIFKFQTEVFLLKIIRFIRKMSDNETGYLKTKRFKGIHHIKRI